MNGPELLNFHAGILRTKVGACWPGSRAVFRGHDLHQDLRTADWLELYLFGITGRRFTPAQTKLLHGIWVITSYPDARLWNNRVAALGASARSTPVLSLAAALAISEAGIYGGRPGVKGIDFFMRAGQELRAGGDLRQLVHRELESNYIYGYGRPLNSHDERLIWLAECARSNGMGDGEHFKIAFAVEKILVEELGKASLKMNYAGMTSALGADLGLSPREFHLLRFTMFLAGMAPCWVEAAEKPEGALFPTPCSAISYEGVEQRTWKNNAI